MIVHWFDSLAIGADLLDLTGKHSIDHDNHLKEIATVFELTEPEKIQLAAARQQSELLRERYHSMHETIWDTGYLDTKGFPER